MELARRGVRPCDISRQLRITHGCVSKLLSKFKMTGSVEHGGRHVGRPRVISRCMARKIEQYKQEKPQMFSWEIRDRLLQESECTDEQLPSLSSINRLVRHRIRRKNEERTRQQRCGKNSFMMASILDLPSKDSDESGKTGLRTYLSTFFENLSEYPSKAQVKRRTFHETKPNCALGGLKLRSPEWWVRRRT